jgi:hypothetical protein
MMPGNIGIVDQAVRAILGLAAIAYVFRGGPFLEGTGLIGFLGIYLLATALFVYCPLYGVLGLSTVGRLDRSA